MAELSIDALRSLARNFLIGKGGEAELEDTKRAMESDPQLAMEFLQQMQTALEDSAPAGFTPEQWKDIDGRVAALIAPLAKGGLGLGFIGKLFARLFKKKPASEGPARIKKGRAPEERPKAASESPTSLLSSEPVVAPAMAAPIEGMEDMAPIAPVAAAPAPAASPAAEAAPEIAAPKKARSKKPLWILLAILAAVGLGYGLYVGYGIWKASRPKPAPPAVPTPMPTPSPTQTPYSGPPRRSQPPAEQHEPLPSELPPMTPQPAGHVRKIPNLEANDSEGKRGLPLP